MSSSNLRTRSEEIQRLGHMLGVRKKSEPIYADLNMLTGSVGVPPALQYYTYVDPQVKPDLRIMAEPYLPELQSMHIKLGQFICSGSYGDVVMGLYMERAEIAIKICDLTHRTDVREGMAIAREFNHENIIGIIHTLDKSDVLFIVMPLADNDLFDTIYNGGAFGQFHARHMCKQILSGLQYMHNKGFAHRDIKMENILLFNRQEKYKICDLDSVVRVFDENGLQNIVDNFGTALYMPPEMLLKQPFCDPRAHDVWSFGILAHTSVTFTFAFGNIVYGHQNLSKKIKRMRKQVIKYPPGCHTHPVFEAFIKECLVFEQTQRPTVNALLQNPWFTITIPETHDRFRPCRIHHGIDRSRAVSTASNCCCAIV